MDMAALSQNDRVADFAHLVGTEHYCLDDLPLPLLPPPSVLGFLAAGVLGRSPVLGLIAGAASLAAPGSSVSLAAHAAAALPGAGAVAPPELGAVAVPVPVPDSGAVAVPVPVSDAGAVAVPGPVSDAGAVVAAGAASAGFSADPEPGAEVAVAESEPEAELFEGWFFLLNSLSTQKLLPEVPVVCTIHLPPTWLAM